MLSPKSRASEQRRTIRKRKRKHLNKKFYNSKEWKATRTAYINWYRQKCFRDIPKGVWYTKNKDRLTMKFHQVSYLLSLDYLPCEICMKLYAVEAYDKVDEGIELDHIEALNPENALISDGFGDPFDFNNLQLLCRRHHSRKSNRG